MLKTTKSLDEPVSSRNNNSKSASNKNDNSKLVSERNDGDGKVDGYGVGESSIEYAKESGKSKSEKKTSKS